MNSPTQQTEVSDAELADFNAMMDAVEAAERPASGDPDQGEVSQSPELDNVETANVGDDSLDGLEEMADDAAEPSTTGKDNKADEGTETQPEQTPKETDKTPEAEKPKDDADQETKPDDEKPLSKYEKERRRRDDSWKRLNEEKEAHARQIEAERQAIQREKEALEAARQKYQAEVGEFTPEDYEKAAERLEQEGKHELAAQSREVAKEIREKAAKAGGMTPERQAYILEQHKRTWEQARAEMPDLADTNSALNKGVREFVRQNQEILQYPKGPYLAAKYVAAEQAASRLTEVQKENESLKKRVAELEAATSPGDAGLAAGGPPPPKSFSEMSLKEQENELEAMWLQEAREAV